MMAELKGTELEHSKSGCRGYMEHTTLICTQKRENQI